MNEKKMIFNVDLDSESDQEDKKVSEPTSGGPKKGEWKEHTRKFQSKALTKGFFEKLEEEHEFYAVVVPAELSNLVSKKLQQPPKEQQPTNIPLSSSIKLLHQIQYSSEEEEEEEEEGEGEGEGENDNHQEAITEPAKQKAEQPLIQTDSSAPIQLPGINSSVLQKLMEIGMESSSEQEQSGAGSEEQSIDSKQEMKRLLSLETTEKALVKVEEIHITPSHFDNMKIYTTKPVELGKLLRLQLVRDTSGFNSLWPEYWLYIEGTKMLFSKKMMGSTTSNYYFTLDSGIDNVNNQKFIAKLRSNYKGNVYQVYTRGTNPQKAVGGQKIRQIEATIVFLCQNQQQNQPRSFEVYTLALDAKYFQLTGVKKGQEVGLDILYQIKENQSKIFLFRNRKPIYSSVIQGYILNFQGRVQRPSVKNFILEDVIAQREVLMLGKTKDDIFHVDVSWPLKPYVAFCICIANNDSQYTGN